MTEIAIRTPTDLAAWVRSPDRRAELARALPEGVTITRFERLTTTALLQRPDLLEADQTSLWFALLDAAKRGLAPDGRQGVINVYNTKVKRNGKEEWVKKAQFLPMIGGVRDELAEYGWALRTIAIYSNDEFAYDIAADRVTHKEGPLGDRGEIVGAWAQVIRMRDGFRLCEVMSRPQIEEVRDKAKAGDSPLWRDRFRQACEKTVGHRLAKKTPLAERERERILALIAAESDPDEPAVDQLYGPAPEDPVGADGKAATTEGSQPPAEVSPTLPSAGAAGDEPEPGPEPEPVDEQQQMEDALEALADQAAGFTPPNGKYAAGGENGPKTFAEIAALGAQGEKWFAWALPRIQDPPEYAAALWSFCRIRLPGVYQEAAARRDLGEGV